MDMWTDIRQRVLGKGESKRSVLRDYHIHWTTLDKILTYSEPPGYQQSKPRGKPKLEPFLPIIHDILEKDKGVHHKQRHTAKRIFDRLVEEHDFDGGYTIVREAVKEWRDRSREAFVPLSHLPGEAQVDFGHADIVLNGVQIKGAMFVMTLPQSDAIFVCIYPRECTEAFLDGHIRAFQFFGGVPRRISYDNTKIAVAKIVGGRGHTITREFQRLVSHFLFEYHFCLVRRPNEKGHVERLLAFARRNYLVPVPHVASLEALNTILEQKCFKDLSRRLRGKPATKLVMLEDDRKAFLPMPDESFETGRVRRTHANSLSLVRFDCNDYSVPTRYAYHPITAIGGIEEVRLVCDCDVVARHARIWEKEKISFDPIHYLALLERKPGAFDYARPLEQWDLPDCVKLLRRRLEAEFEHRGTREFIKVLRLLEKFKLSELTRAVEKALEYGTIDVVAVRLILEGLREQPARLFNLDGRPHLSHVRVEPPRIAAYASLTDGEEVAS